VHDDRLRAAGQLIQFGLRPRLFPGQDREYRDLLARYRLELEFQEAVDAVADGLGLTVASATELGLLLAAEPGSVFAYTLSTFRRDRGGVGGYEDRLLHGLGMVAIVAYFYPTAHDLERESHRPVAPREVERYLRAACDQLGRTSGDGDVAADKTEFEQAWRLYLRQKEAVETSDGRRAQRGTLAVIDRCFAMLEAQGLVRKVREVDDNPPYQPMERLRLMVGTVAGHHAFELLRRIRQEQQEGVG
jgi:hypothetical protein